MKKTDWTKAFTVWHSSQCHKNKWRGVGEEETMEEWIDFCCCFFLFVRFFLNFLLEVRVEYGGTGRWMELGCMMWNSRRFNKEIMLNSKTKKVLFEWFINEHCLWKKWYQSWALKEFKNLKNIKKIKQSIKMYKFKNNCWKC